MNRHDTPDTRDAQLSLALGEDEPAAAGATTSPPSEISSPPTSELPATAADGLDYCLAAWQEAGWIRPLDVAFARTVRELTRAQGEATAPLVILLAALVSHQVGRGHVCIDLDALLSDASGVLAMPPQDEPYALNPESHRLPRSSAADALAHLGGRTVTACVRALTTSSAVGDGSCSTPLVLDGTRLYLRRYWLYEQAVARGIHARLQRPTLVADAAAPAAGVLTRALDILFPGSGETDYQKLACALAARTGFGVITGGPGTGKTTTVVKLLAALQAVAGESDERQGRKLRIRLAAPTGKAAARLNESIGGAVHDLPLAALPGNVTANDIPVAVSTLHRLLGSRPGSRFFRYGADNPLPLDILVIDEASMVDLEMMAAVFEALPPYAQVILLGDKDQLASVDAGAVLGDLCRRAQQGFYQPRTARWLTAVTGQSLPDDFVDPEGQPLDQAIAMLRKTYRFEAGSGIQQLAEAVNQGYLGADLTARCRTAEFEDVLWLDIPRARDQDEREAALRALCRHTVSGSPQAFRNGGEQRAAGGRPVPPPVGYRHYLELMQQHTLTAESPRQSWDAFARSVLTAFGHFQLLCALRRGPWGVEALNARIARYLVEQGLLSRAEGWYAGRPVLITGNDYNLGLMNGDIGITFSLPWGRVDGEGRREQVLRVAFPSGDGADTVRWVSPSRLQRLETVFAMTVHKSQGSEFTHTCLVLPDHPSPILTRELIYTGITRARSWFSLVVGDEEVLERSVRQQIARVSALSNRIRRHGRE